MKIVQITDTHFRAEETTVHWGYRSQATYRTFLEAVAEGHADVDMVIITGDCVACYPVEEDPAFSPEGEPAYRLLRSMAEEAKAKDKARTERLAKAHIVEEFLQDTASQLTYFGLEQLHSGRWWVAKVRM